MERRNVTFTVKDMGPGEPLFIAIEYYGPIHGTLKAEIYLQLPPGTDVDRAQEIARFLKSNIFDVRVQQIEE